MKVFTFHEYTWPQVRERILAADKEFTEIVDNWNPGKEFTFIELSYPFGAHLLDVNQGGFQVPLDNGSTVALQDDLVPKELQKKLGYSAFPLGVVIEGGIEIYHQLNDRVFSLAFFNKGFNLGVWEAFGPPAPYSAVAGARSLIMVPKITDSQHHRKLQMAFGLRQSVPRHLFDQWRVFTELAKHDPKPWQVKVLFLNKKSFDGIFY